MYSLGRRDFDDKVFCWGDVYQYKTDDKNIAATVSYNTHTINDDTNK